MKATFFGHRDTPWEVERELKRVVEELIKNGGVDTFYMGNQGNFDRLAYKVLKELSVVYPHISYFVVLAYLPEPGTAFNLDGEHTLYPEELEKTPRKFAISKRNRYLVLHSDVVVTCARYSFGGAAEFKTLAEKKGKIVINIGEKPDLFS